MWGVRGPALSHPRLPALWAGCRGPLPTGCGCGGVQTWGPVTNPTARALSSWLCALWGRHKGVRGGGASCLDVGRPGSGTLPPPTTRPFGRAAGACFPLAVGAVCGRGVPAVLGTLSRAAVRRVLCALPGFAAPGGCCGLAPVLVPWLWLVACLSGVPRGPALYAAPRPVRSLSVLQSAFPSPWCLPQPRGLSPPALLGGCAGRVVAGREPDCGL